MSNYNTFFTALVYSTLVQQIYWLWKILLVYTLQSTVLLECVKLKSKVLGGKPSVAQMVFDTRKSKTIAKPKLRIDVSDRTM